MIYHVLCLVSRFTPFFIDKRRQKFTWMFIFPPSLLPYNIKFFVYAFYNYNSKARYLAQRQTNNCNCCQRTYTALFRRDCSCYCWYGFADQICKRCFSFSFLHLSLNVYQLSTVVGSWQLIMISLKYSTIKMYASKTIL